MDTKVELSVSCQNLPNLDRFSKTDPMCVLYRLSGKKQWDIQDQTEVIKDTLNPTFAKTFLLEYHFEERQAFKLIFYDIDDESNLAQLYSQEYIGEIEFYLADVLTSGSKLEKTLIKQGVEVMGENKKPSVAILQTEEVVDSKYNILLQLYCTNLEKKDFFGKSDPYLEISKMLDNSSYVLAYRTETIYRTLNPRWPTFEISIQKLCSGQFTKQLKFACFDWNRSGDHELIGEAYTTLQELILGSVKELPLINPKYKHKKSSGMLHFGSVRDLPVDSFLDYIQGGCKMKLIVAIDFTSSNGSATKPTSLHFNDPHWDNQYVMAIKSVATVLDTYTSDHKIVAYGFGARSPQIGGVSHCFPLNGNMDDPHVDGIEGLLESYQSTLNTVELFGPTNFSVFLDKTMEMASEKVDQEHQVYYLLLIITDGVITDMLSTKDKIVAASDLPLSIIIVGVGNANFDSMVELDADDKPLVDRKGVMMKRDIVQFIQMKNTKTGPSSSLSLPREALAELPSQFISYMQMHRIKPNLPSKPLNSKVAADYLSMHKELRQL